MPTRGQINSNFYQIVDVDSNGNPIKVTNDYIEPSGNNTEVQFNDNGTLGSSSNFTFNKDTNTLSVTNLTGSITNALHANVADVANLISVGNVVGIGNIATINLDGNSQHILSGNGSWIDTPNTASANYANYAGNAFSVDLSNVVGIGNIASINLDGNVSNLLSGAGTWVSVPSTENANYANYAGNAFSVDGSNVVGYVSDADHATIANIANVAYSVDGSNVTGQVANALVAGTVYINDQPNITSVGTLTNLVVSGNISANNANINNMIDVSYIDFNTGVTPTIQTGRFHWESTEGTVTVDMTGNVEQQIGFTQYFYVKAESPITKGQVVQFAGAQGDFVLAKPCDVNSVGFESKYVMGLASQDLATNDFGYVQTFGKLEGIITEIGWNQGDILYVDPTVVGGLTNVRPEAPNIKVVIAAVQKPSSVPGTSGNGILLIRVGPSLRLGDLENVKTITATSNDVLVYNGGYWDSYSEAPLANSVTNPNQGNITHVGTLDLLMVSGNVDVGGDLNITGNLNYSNINDLVVSDPLIYIGANNTGNLVDLGLVASYNDGTYYHTGIARDHTDGVWKLFGNVTAEPTTVIDWANAVMQPFEIGNLTVSNVVSSGNISAISFIGNGSQLTNINGANVSEVANATYATNAGSSVEANHALIADEANVAYSVDGGNVLGNVATAVYAYSVDGANVSGAVASATNADNAYEANHATLADSADYATEAEQANTANVAYSVDGSNVVGYVSDADHATISNIANIAYSVDLSNVAGIGNIASINLDGNISNVLAGDGSWVTQSGGGGGTPAGSNSQVQYNDNGSFGADANFVYYGNGITLGGNAIAGFHVGSLFGSVATKGVYDNTTTSASMIFAKQTPIDVSGIELENGNLIITSQVPGGISYTHKFSNGDIIFPDATVQNTAFTGTIAGSNVVGYVSDANHATVSNVGNSVVVTTTNSTFTNPNSFGAPLVDTKSITLVDSGSGNLVEHTMSSIYLQATAYPLQTVPYTLYVPNLSSTGTISGVGSGLTSINGANVTGTVGNATHATVSDSANSVSLANVNGIGNIASINLDGNVSHVLAGDGTWVTQSGGGGTPGGLDTQLQYNNSGSFGGISTVTYDGSNISLGDIDTVKITGGSSNLFVRTDGTGNLSYAPITSNLTVATRAIAVNIGISNYTMNVESRTGGNIVVNVN